VKADILDFLPAILAGSRPLLPPCQWTIPAESSAQGDYRAYGFSTPSEVDAVAIANRGWRAVAGCTDYKVYYFQRGQDAPLFSFLTGGQVNTVDIAENGCAFVAGSFDGKIYYFECDNAQPVWTYNAYGDITSGSTKIVAVDISRHGRWIAAITPTHVYLFRRDRSQPVLKVNLSSIMGDRSLATLDLAEDSTEMVVGTRSGTSCGAYAVYLGKNGVKWSYYIDDQCACGVNFHELPVSISADGNVIAAGGCDQRVRLWDAASSTPRWTKLMPHTDYPVSAVRLNDAGTNLAVSHYGYLYFIQELSTSPALETGNNWTWEGVYSHNNQPSVYPGFDDDLSSLDGWGVYTNSDSGAIDMSYDGSYLFVAPQYYSGCYTFYRDYNDPLRAYHVASGDSVYSVDVSPDGSWVIFGGGYSIRRIEVAPVEVISCEIPLTYNVTGAVGEEIVELLGGNKFEIDYQIIKPGRGSVLEQNWEMWVAPAGGGAVIPPDAAEFLCTGTSKWNFQRIMGDGNQVLSGSEEITPPTCVADFLTTIDFFYLDDKLRDQVTSKNLSRDSAILADVQISTTGP